MPKRSDAPTPLQVELRQAVPFRSPAHEAVVGLARSASLLERSATLLLRPWGMSLAQFNVLRILRGARPDGLPTLAIRDRMVDPAAAVTRLVDKLVQAGLVSRERAGADRRQVVCRITEAGLAQLAEVDPLVHSVEDAVAGVLSEAELVELNRMLVKVRGAT
jgi:DNA-binding MarR family transcriptional regulator